MKVSDVDLAPDEKIDERIKTMPNESAKIIKGINELQELKVIELGNQDRVKIKKKYKDIKRKKKDEKISDEKLDVYFQLQEEIAKNKKSETISALYVLLSALSPVLTLVGVIFLGKFLFNLVENLLSAETDDAEADTYKKIELFLRAVKQRSEQKKLDVGDLQRIENELNAE